MTEQLVTGSVMPAIMGKDLEGNDVDLTASVAGQWAAILLYRGDW